MRKTILLVGSAMMLLALVAVVLGVAVNGFGTTGEYTGDDQDDQVVKKNVYCKAYLEGKFNVVGSDLELSQLQCRTNRPFFMSQNFFITAAKDVECRGYLMKDDEIVSTSNTQTFGDVGTFQEEWYKFGISQVPVGAYTAKVTCESRADPADTATVQKTIDVSR